MRQNRVAQLSVRASFDDNGLVARTPDDLGGQFDSCIGKRLGYIKMLTVHTNRVIDVGAIPFGHFFIGMFNQSTKRVGGLWKVVVVSQYTGFCQFQLRYDILRLTFVVLEGGGCNTNDQNAQG